MFGSDIEKMQSAHWESGLPSQPVKTMKLHANICRFRLLTQDSLIVIADDGQGDADSGEEGVGRAVIAYAAFPAKPSQAV